MFGSYAYQQYYEFYFYCPYTNLLTLDLEVLISVENVFSDHFYCAVPILINLVTVDLEVLILVENIFSDHFARFSLF